MGPKSPYTIDSDLTVCDEFKLLDSTRMRQRPGWGKIHVKDRLQELVRNDSKLWTDGQSSTSSRRRLTNLPRIGRVPVMDRFVRDDAKLFNRDWRA